MAFTKSSLIEAVMAPTGLTKKRSTEIVETLLELMKRSLEAGDVILVSGFGRFSVRAKHERRGRNPATGQDLMLPPRKVVSFKCSGKLRMLLNGRQSAQ
jgi:integration host factor subunit alpha